jgi:Protein of unknown function (DUF1186)/SEC-C motif
MSADSREVGMRKQELEAILGDGPNLPDLGPIEDHLHALATERRLPDYALGMCTIRIEESAPALRAVLARAAEGETLSDDEATLLFRGLHVLGGARDRAAFEPLLRLLRRPVDQIDPLLGDTTTETLARIVAGVFEGDDEALFQAVADEQIDEFVRDAFLGAAAFLTWEGRIERERMKAFLERFYENGLAADGDHAWIGWVQAVALLGMRDLAPLVEAAWSEGRLPERVMEPRHFEEDLAAAERAPQDIGRFKRAHLGYIDDVAEALDWARSFEGSDADREPRWTGGEPAPRAPSINPWRHIGRNDPCFCGSGKKAKKCCLVG